MLTDEDARHIGPLTNGRQTAIRAMNVALDNGTLKCRPPFQGEG
jgi:hypothetical protein